MTRAQGRSELRRLTIVLADWCPHCVPHSERHARRLARRLGIPFRRLDIDQPRQERLADRLVRDHGDASPDYLIPQVFLEWKDGRVDHVLTGFSEAVSRTARAWKDLFQSDWLRSLAEEARR
jgi:glutaredoxin